MEGGELTLFLTCVWSWGWGPGLASGCLSGRCPPCWPAEQRELSSTPHLSYSEHWQCRSPVEWDYLRAGKITSVSVSRWWLSLVDNECYLLFTACWSRSSNCYSHEEWQVWPTLRQPLTVCQPGLRATEWEQGRDFSSLTRLPASLILGTLTVHWTSNMYSTVQHYLSYVLTEALICIIQFSWTNIGTLALAWVTYKFSFIKSSRKIGNG